MSTGAIVTTSKREDEAAAIITNVCQILDVVKQEWGAEECWSKWDQEVRTACTEWLREYYAHRGH